MPSPVEDIVEVLQGIDRLFRRDGAAARTYLGIAATMVRRAARFLVVPEVIRDPRLVEELASVGIDIAVEDHRADTTAQIGNIEHNDEDRDLYEAGMAILGMDGEATKAGSHRKILSILARAKAAEIRSDDIRWLRAVAMELAPYCTQEPTTDAVMDAIDAVGVDGAKMNEQIAALFPKGKQPHAEHIRSSLRSRK